MCAVSSLITRLCDLLLHPFRGLAPVWGIAFLSLITAVFALYVYRAVSNQTAIKMLKKRIQGYFLGIYLFRDDLTQILVSEWRVFSNVIRYMGHALLPLAVMMVPIALLCIQMQMRYGYENPGTGDSVLVAAVLTPDAKVATTDVRIETSGGLNVRSPALRIAAKNEVEWKIGVARDGAQAVRLIANGAAVEKRIRRAEPWQMLSPVRGKASFLNCLLYPGEEPIDGESDIREVRVGYSSARVSLGGVRLHWSIVYFALAIVFGLIFKGLFKVEF